MSKRDANDVASECGPEGLAKETDLRAAAAVAEAANAFPTVAELARKHGRHLREPIITGLMRRGEIMNVIAPPKGGKTWFAYHMALAVAAGWYFLNVEDWKCAEGNVVIFDNELHEETMASRLPLVAEKLNYGPEYLERIRVVSLRGKNVDVDGLQAFIAKIKVLKPKLVILDALYRFMPKGMKESDNADITQLYNKLDQYAEQLGSAGMVLVHHSSKGEQADKDIMDVGSGGGSFGRATDNHLVIRQHEEEKHYVIEAKPRSWPSPAPVTCLWDYPLWSTTDIDPSKLKGRKQQKTRDKPPDDLNAGILPALSNDWKQQALVTAELRALHNLTLSDAQMLMNKIISRQKLLDLLPIDGVKDCGIFEARKSGVSLQFKLKG